MLNVYFDTEFTGLHKNTTLISIGLVAAGGERFYAELTDYDPSQIDEWLQDNVLANLKWKTVDRNYNAPDPQAVDWDEQNNVNIHCSSKVLAKHLETWFERLIAREVVTPTGPQKIQMVSDCYAYDWVLFGDLWGHAFKVPEQVFYIPKDLSTMFMDAGIDPDTNREEFAEMIDGAQKHNALWDALVIQECHKRLTKILEK